MQGFWNQPIVVAVYRAAVGAAVLAGGAFFGALQGGAGQRAAEVAAGVAFFAYLTTRGFVEGMIDQQAARP